MPDGDKQFSFALPNGWFIPSVADIGPLINTPELTQRIIIEKRVTNGDVILIISTTLPKGTLSDIKSVLTDSMMAPAATTTIGGADAFEVSATDSIGQMRTTSVCIFGGIEYSIALHIPVGTSSSDIGGVISDLGGIKESWHWK